MINKQFKMAQVLHQRGELKKALNIYSAIRGPARTRQVDIYHALCLCQIGRLDEAKAVIESVEHSALEQYAEFVTTALVLKTLGDIETAVILLKKTIEKFPDRPITHLNLAVAYLALDLIDDCEHELERALMMGLDSAELRLNQAQVAVRRLNLEDAEKYVAMAEEKNPGHFDIFYLRGLIAEQQYDIPRAFEGYVQALKRNISSPTAWERLTIILNDGAWFRDEADLKPLANLFKAAREQNITSLKTLTHIVNIQKRTLIWTELGHFESKLIEGLKRHERVAAPSPFVTLTLPLEQTYITKAYSFQNTPIKRISSLRKRKPKDNPKVAFISSDLRNHAIGYLLKDVISTEQVFKDYDCIFTGDPESSDIYKKYKNSFSRFYEAMTLTTEDKLGIIKSREIDVIIDLNGFTGRPSIETIRGVDIPVVHWLGLPSSTGSEIYDFLVCDEIVVPRSEEKSISEAPIYLPRSYVPSRYLKEKSISGGEFTFASFQNLFKLNPALLKTWSEILSGCKDAKFIIASKDEDREALLALLNSHQFELDRVTVVPFLRFDLHLDRLAEVSCILDTFPYNGGTSCADALELGVPVVTLYGQSVVSRVASSILHSANLFELVGKDIEDYKRIACDLYEGKIQQSEINKKLSESYFANPEQFALDFHEQLVNQVRAHYE